jgi:class 3 adenylate cyclase
MIHSRNRSVIAFAGHMIDAPGRKQRRFPATAVSLVAGALSRELDQLRPAAGVTSLASGSDILFAEEIVRRETELHVLLPVSIPEFIQESVEPAGKSWVRRFHSLIKRTRTLEIYGDSYFKGSGSPFQLGALLIDGTAQLLASERNFPAVSLGIWDGRPGDGMGGAASFMGHSVQRGRRIRAIHPATGEAFVPGPEAIIAAQRHSWGTTPLGDTVLEHRLCSFLFADVKGFGGLRETQMPQFVQSVIKMIAAAVKASNAKPLVLNTWGDGLLVVTESPGDVAEIGLRLVEGTRARPGERRRFSFRVGLHCGPAFYLPNDPITGKSNVYGADVNRAARIEPVTKPGQVWASRAFVVMAAALNAEGLRFEDQGEFQLPKNSGMLRLSRITRRKG